MTIPTDKIRDVIGTGGKVIREICEVTGCKVDIEDDGTDQGLLRSDAKRPEGDRLDHAHRAEPEVGDDLRRQGCEVVDFGAFVNFLGPAMVWCTFPNSDRGAVTVTDVINEGDEVKVKVHRDG